MDSKLPPGLLIIIFVLVSLQSYMFASPEFDYVFRYLEAEQIGAIVSEQEKKAAWKTAQLQHICESEEKMCQRNLRVEKMKSELLNLQIQLHDKTPSGGTPPDNERVRRSVIGNIYVINLDKEVINK
ncbi:ion channel [Lithospermum erythrorhizon]|uniref:Ion channel n=1 Tax=Lithospermum erythrorhizon TaxID=34254 RepID=A0AAV3PMN7_LITER